MRFAVCFVGFMALFLVAATPGQVLSRNPTAQASPQDEAGRKLLAEWDQMIALIRKARRDLGEFQVRFSGAESPEDRRKWAAEFERVRSETIAKAKDFVGRVAQYIESHPDDVALRKRRLEDTHFDALPLAVKAKDAERLYQLIGDAVYLNTAADYYDKAYDYEKSRELWAEAAQKAPTSDKYAKLGDACMNTNRFAEAKVAFERARDLASADRDKRKHEQAIKAAVQYVEDWQREQKLHEKDDLPIAEIDTTRGKMVVELFEDEAPNTVANFITLAEAGFFDNTAFHRCMAYFMIQGGDPEGTGRGGPGYRIKDECGREDARLHYRGSLSMANEQKPDSNGSQFFVTSVNTWQLNGRHTVFGRVLEGLHVAEVPPLDPTNKAEPFGLKTVRIIRKRDHDYVVEKIPQ